MKRKVVNGDWVLHNLQETAEHIQSLIDRIEKGNAESALEAWMRAIYRDLNRTWNGRFCKNTPKASGDESLCRFPTDLDVAD